LNLPCLSGVVYLSVISKNKIVAYKKLERGMREEYNLPLPVVIGLDPDINKPRYVAPYSRAYCSGIKRDVESMDITGLITDPDKRVRVDRFCQRKPRVKQGIDVASLSMQDRLRMIRGELGDKKRVIQGNSTVAAKEILKAIENC
jgi:electron transfer flavoprotein alpha/beta subunit